VAATPPDELAAHRSAGARAQQVVERLEERLDVGLLAGLGGDRLQGP